MRRHSGVVSESLDLLRGSEPAERCRKGDGPLCSARLLAGDDSQLVCGFMKQGVRWVPRDLPHSVQAIWADVTSPWCRRCLLDSGLSVRLEHVAKTYFPYPTVGVLPPNAVSVTHFLVGSEPSTAFDSEEDARKRIADGARNFAGGVDESCLQYAMENWLLEPGQGYYFTDFAKCTMPTDLARKTPERYDLCSVYFVRELQALRPLVIVAVGGDAYRALKHHRLRQWPTIFSILHYSPQANAWHQRVAALATPEHIARVPSLADLAEFMDARRRAFGKTTPSRHRPNRQHLTLLKAYSVQFSIIREMLQAEHPRSDARSMVHVNVAIERED